MQGAARQFFALAIIYGIAGMLLGLSMAISHDHLQLPTHAHTMVAGWVSSAIFAFFYHQFPAIGQSRLAAVHFWLQAVSGVVLVVSLYFLTAGNEAIEPITATASMAFLAGMLLFAWIALPVLRKS
jgi:cbb3-type cytochrome oxidase subunit 1